VRRAAGPGPHYSIDDDRLGARRLVVSNEVSCSCALGARVIGSRIGDFRHANANSGGCEGVCDDPRVAAVVSGTREHNHTASELTGIAVRDFGGRRRTGPLHERARWNTSVDRHAISGGRLGGGDDVRGHAAVVRQGSIVVGGWRNGGQRAAVSTARHYLCDCPTDRPKLISPLSIRKLNPQSGLLHTHALYVMGAPSRP